MWSFSSPPGLIHDRHLGKSRAWDHYPHHHNPSNSSSTYQLLQALSWPLVHPNLHQSAMRMFRKYYFSFFDCQSLRHVAWDCITYWQGNLVQVYYSWGASERSISDYGTLVFGRELKRWIWRLIDHEQLGRDTLWFLVQPKWSLSWWIHR